MYIEGKACWLNHLDAALQKYNNRVHGTTKLTPFEGSNNTEALRKNYTAKLASHTEGERWRAPHTFPKFQVGDFVRVPDKRNIYSKGYSTNWNRELFKIHKINSTNPVTYTLEEYIQL